MENENLFEPGLVSVIIPAYNHQNYIRECIDSIAKQTYPNIELLIIDDGSPDNTYEEIEKTLKLYPDRFQRVWAKKQENTGKTEVLNRLIEQSRGEYIYIIDSDDIAKPWAIDVLLSFLKDNPDYALAVGDNEFIDKDSVRFFYTNEFKVVYNESQAVIRNFADNHRLRLVPKDVFGRYDILFTQGNHIPNGYLVRSTELKKIPKFTKEAPQEDYYMMLQLSKCNKLKYIDETLYLRRIHDTNVSNNKDLMNDMFRKTYLHEIAMLVTTEMPEGILPDVKNFIINYVFPRIKIERQ